MRILLGTERPVKELEIVLASEKGVLTGHPDACDNMILNQSSERLSRCWHQVLVISIGDKSGFSTGHLVLLVIRIYWTRIDMMRLKTYEGNVCSFLAVGSDF
jgi:hypothetical protein